MGKLVCHPHSICSTGPATNKLTLTVNHLKYHNANLGLC